MEYVPQTVQLSDMLRLHHNDDYVIDTFISSFKKIHNHLVPYNSSDKACKVVADEVQKLKTHTTILIPQRLLDKAIDLSDQLVASQKNVYLLHGDLHCDNIMVTEQGCVAIDPRGLIGELEYEATSFMISPIYCLVETDNFKEIIVHRIDRLSAELNFDRQRLQDWLFIKVMEAACFFESETIRPDLVNIWIEFARVLETIE